MLTDLQKLKIHPPAVEQRSIQLADKNITYTLKRSSKRRSIGLQINDDGLTVSMPLRASEKWLHSVLQEKAAWIVDKLESWQSKKNTGTKVGRWRKHPVSRRTFYATHRFRPGAWQTRTFRK
jgi:predicted metal-dependent hydrolase